jgi:PAS domain S-box-containing protein
MRPLPKNEEIRLDPKRYIVSKTDAKGMITYGNDYFVEISGYTESELIKQPHNIIRHPDMPKVVFKLMWDRIQSGKQIMAVVKNLAKDGRYYWVVTEFESKTDKLTNEIIGYTAFRKAGTKDSVKIVEPLYTKLIQIEETNGIEAAEQYLLGFLEDKGVSYDEFIDNIVGNKGLFKVFFTAMKKIFA